MSPAPEYSDAEFEAQYDNRAAVPEYVEITADWERRSERLRATRPCRLDLAYGDSERQKIDLFTVSKPRAPLHVYVHGGYWQRGDKRIFSCVAESFLDRGVSVALVGYDLCPSVSIDAIVSQVRAALAWLWRNAGELGVDGERIQVSGHSAGGHLTAMLMATRWSELGDDLPARLIHSALAISGLYDLDPMRHTSLNDALGLDAASARRASPVLLVPGSNSPLTVAVGALESAEFHRQAEELVASWQRHGAPMQLLEVPAGNHFTIVDELVADGVILARAMALLEA